MSRPPLPSVAQRYAVLFQRTRELKAQQPF